MSDAAGDLRAAADCVDDARTYLEQGGLEVPDDELQLQVAGIDDVAKDLEDTLREVALLVEVDDD